jgi:hypothetical protein
MDRQKFGSREFVLAGQVRCTVYRSKSKRIKEAVAPLRTANCRINIVCAGMCPERSRDSPDFEKRETSLYFWDMSCNNSRVL